MSRRRSSAGGRGKMKINPNDLMRQVQQMQTQMGAAVLVEIAGEIAGKHAGAAEAATKVAATMAGLKYSREHEYEADDLGGQYLMKTQYNPYGMVELLTALNSLSEGEPSLIEGMLSTHPHAGDRVERAKERIAATGQYSPDQPDPHRERFLTYRQMMMSDLGWTD